MKKLALALMCFASVAFFASCDPVVQNPEPNIAILTSSEVSYLTDGQVIEVNEVYPYGFIASSNPETMKELASLVVKCGETILCDTAISGTTFTFTGEIYFEENREIIGNAEIIATVKDAAGETNSASIKVNINKEDNLEPAEFTWNRHGGTAATGLEEFGLQWTSNTKVIYANIRPLDGATLYKFDPEVWEATTTEAQKAALFTEQVAGISVFNEVSCDATHDYDFVIGTTYNGENHLIHITKAVVTPVTGVGTDITITGEAK